MSSDLPALVTRLESVTTRLEGLASRGGLAAGGGGGDVNSEIVEEFDSRVGGKLKAYYDLSNQVGGDVAQHAGLVKEAFTAGRSVLESAAKHKQPKPDVLQSVMAPLGAAVEKVQQFTDKNRSSKLFNHLMTVKEGIGCVGWVTVSPKPGPYVKESFNQALFYGNRVIKEYKGKNELHIQWMRSFTAVIQELEGYVREYHTTGLVWNPQGSDMSGAPPPPPPAGGAGPPPPPPPAVQPPTASSSGGGDDTTKQRANLFASINKGGDVTRGLRKVTDSMKTHKNPELRASSIVKAQDKPAPAKAAPKYGAPATKKPPVLELQGKKWVVEFQEDRSNLSITNTNPKQVVYVYKCNKSTLKVSGKVNSIILDSCKRMALCFDGVISCVEVVNSSSVQVQVTGKCPTVSIDKTDGCQVFLSKDSLNCEIVSAKSSEMNICIPGKDGGDYIERPVPEQFKSRWNGKALVTECTDIAS